MSGHSHWSGIKHKKALQDSKRSKLFTRYAKPIIIAAQNGGSNPETNFALKIAVDQAKTINMPKDNIERAIARGIGKTKDGLSMKSVLYEAYGPGNVAMLLTASTDNTNRTVSEIKSLLTKNGGKMVTSGSVGFMFKHCGQIIIKRNTDWQESYDLILIDAGAEDIIYEEDVVIVYTKITDLQKIKEVCETAHMEIYDVSFTYIALQKVNLDKNSQELYEVLYDILDNHDDIQNIYDNINA